MLDVRSFKYNDQIQQVGPRPHQTQTSPPVLGHAEVPHPRTPPQAQPPAFSTLPHMRSSPPPPNPGPGAARPPPATVVQRPAAARTTTAIPIPPLRQQQLQQQASALPAHSVWGRAASSRRPGSETTSAVSDDGSTPSADESAAAAAAAAADRRRLERFAAGEPAGRGTTAAGSSRSSSPATDSSLRVASRSPSFVFVPPANAGQQVAGSPQQFPQMPRAAVAARPAATAPAEVLPPAKPVAAPKPSPVAQHASFRGWAKLFSAPESVPASSPTTPEDIIAAKFLEATTQKPKPAPAAAAPASPFLAPGTASPLMSPFLAPGTAAPPESPFTAAALAAPEESTPSRVISMPLPPVSPFDTPTLQAASTSDSAFQSAPEEPSSLGSPQAPSSREQTSPGSSAQPASGDASAGHARTDHDRHKQQRPSSSGGWKAKFRRGGRREEPGREEAAAAAAKEKEDAEAEKEKHGRKGSRHSGRHRSSRGSLKELFRGSGSCQESCANVKEETEALPEEEAQPQEVAVATQPRGVLARFKDAFTSGSHTVGPLGPFDSAAAAAARQMGRGIRHVTRPSQGAGQQLVLSRDTREDEAWGKAHAAAAEATQREDKRSGRRKSRHRDRGRPGRGDRGRGRGPTQEGQPPTVAALAKQNGLMMPWEGDPFWQVRHTPTSASPLHLICSV